MIATTASSLAGASQITAGSNSMPTDTKNNTAKASRSGSVSSAARWLNSDSRNIMPAKKAPSAKDTSNNSAAPNATPTAAATTLRVNSSREPVLATHHSSLGSTRRPTTSMNTTKLPTLAKVMPSVDHSAAWSPLSVALLPSMFATGGNSTSISTITRSSTISQPTAMRPLTDSTRPRSSSARNSTTVLATDRHRPNTSEAIGVQPQARPVTRPRPVATPICTMAPGTAMRLTASRSSNEKCKPTPNISSITPISASCADSPASPTKPGVAGPIITPATR